MSARQYVFLLSPPRSFSSVVVNLLGQHPEMYALPELHLFVAETVAEALAYFVPKPQLGADGVLRAVAELREGEQTRPAVERAAAWLAEREAESTLSVFAQIASWVPERIVLEKSPITAFKDEFLRRMDRFAPRARYLHLSRHPRSSLRSMERALHEYDAVGLPRPMSEITGIRLWCQMHRNIHRFLDSLAPERFRTVQGERLLSEPAGRLAPLVRWLGVREDPEAIEAMLHPERSPYAQLGPSIARLGHDEGFFASPRLRSFTSHEPPPTAKELARWSRFAPDVEAICERLGYL